jgi:retron-type reverse transcriptase
VQHIQPVGSLKARAEHRIADKRILRLIAKWLKVGTVEDGRRTLGACGAPQGAVISPILANVYLHYAFDLWVHRWRLTKASGDMTGTGRDLKHARRLQHTANSYRISD